MRGNISLDDQLRYGIQRSPLRCINDTSRVIALILTKASHPIVKILWKIYLLENWHIFFGDGKMINPNCESNTRNTNQSFDEEVGKRNLSLKFLPIMLAAKHFNLYRFPDDHNEKVAR